jgi:type IV secretion system protein VirB3
MKIEDRQDPLFVILTRPPMKLGVPFEALVVNAVLSFFCGLWLRSPAYFLIGVVLHFPMRVIASKDHNFFRVGHLWLRTKANAVKSSLWGGSMVSPLPTQSRRRARDWSSSV